MQALLFCLCAAVQGAAAASEAWEVLAVDYRWKQSEALAVLPPSFPLRVKNFCPQVLGEMKCLLARRT